MQALIVVALAAIFQYAQAQVAAYGQCQLSNNQYIFDSGIMKD
jgi:hypothetical protein